MATVALEDEAPAPPPPVVAFGAGSLGFLAPFVIDVEGCEKTERARAKEIVPAGVAAGFALNRLSVGHGGL